jgi:Anti-sigma-K factor rskA
MGRKRMRRYVAFGVAAVALTYFLDPDNGRKRRRAARAWLTAAAGRPPDRVTAPVETPAEPVGNGRPSVDEEPEPQIVAEPLREPVAVGVAAVSEPDEALHPVAVAEPPATVAEAVLPPPLPTDLLEPPPPEPAEEEADEPEPPAPASRRRWAWLIGGAALLLAALAAAVVAAFAFDVVELSDDDPSTSSAAGLSSLTERQARAISIMAQPGATRLPVVGAEERLLLIVGMEGDAVLIVSRLEAAPPGKTYEIWVISGNTPRPAGLFRGGRDAVVPLTRAVPKGATVALTLERLGGALRPTSEPIFAVTRS